MSHSMAAVLLAAGSALVVGAIALALLYRFSSRSTIWAVRLAPLVAVASIWAGVVTASLTMLLEPQQAGVYFAAVKALAGALPPSSRKPPSMRLPGSGTARSRIAGAS